MPTESRLQYELLHDLLLLRAVIECGDLVKLFRASDLSDSEGMGFVCVAFARVSMLLLAHFACPSLPQPALRNQIVSAGF